MTLKSNDQLNAETPELKDVIVIVDGLNVLDLCSGRGARAARYSVQLSGDVGLSPEGKRVVYSHAAHVLTTLLEGGFSAHANVSRDNIDNDIARATDLMVKAIDLLSTGNEDVILHCHSLSINVVTTDFNLTEMRLLNDEAMDRVMFQLEQPAQSSEALTKLMSGPRKNLIREDQDQSGQSLGTSSTMMIGNELHVQRTFHTAVGTVGVWIPMDMSPSIKTWSDIDQRMLLCSPQSHDGSPMFSLLKPETINGRSMIALPFYVGNGWSHVFWISVDAHAPGVLAHELPKEKFVFFKQDDVTNTQHWVYEESPDDTAWTAHDAFGSITNEFRTIDDIQYRKRQFGDKVLWVPTLRYWEITGYGQFSPSHLKQIGENEYLCPTE